MTTPMKVSTILLTLVIFLGLFAGSGSPQVRSVKVGYIPIISCLPLYAAIENGYMSEEGIKADLMTVAGGGPVIEALAGGSVDIGFVAYVSLIPARAAGIDFVAMAPGNSEKTHPQSYGVYLLVLRESEIAKAKDLEGKKVAVAALKSLNWLAMQEWMSQRGADPKKVTWVEMPFPFMGGALRGKKVDAITTTDPFFTEELGMGGVKNLASVLSEVDPQMPIAGYLASSGWLKKNRDLAARFRRALLKGVDFVNGYPKNRADLMVKYTRIKPELAAKLPAPPFDKTIDLESLQRLIALSLKWGLISKKLPAEEMVWRE